MPFTELACELCIDLHIKPREGTLISPAIICAMDVPFQNNLALGLILNFLEEDLHTVTLCEGRRVPDCWEFPAGSSCLLNWCLMKCLSSLELEVLLSGSSSALKAYPAS